MGRLIFISYRRHRGYELAHLVDAELRSRGLRTFIDVAESDPGQFWPQVKGAIHRCRALVLICTKGSFETREGDDWVVREVSEAIALGRPIVPVFSQDFEPLSSIPPPLAQAIEYNGVSMDTQFHVAAFDHLSQLVGGRKRAEQRRRVAVLGGLALVTLVATLVVGAGAIVWLNGEFNRARDAQREGQAALEKSQADGRRVADQRQRDTDARSDNLAQELAASEKRRVEEKQAADQRLRDAEARSERLTRELDALEKRRQDQIRADEQAAASRDQLAKKQAAQRVDACRDDCDNTRLRCEMTCSRQFQGSATNVGRCISSCGQTAGYCRSSCR